MTSNCLFRLRKAVVYWSFQSYQDNCINKNLLKSGISYAFKQTRRSFNTSPIVWAIARLTPLEVNNILRLHENYQEFFEEGSVKSYDTNQLSSNDPIEDTRTEAQLLQTPGILFGVFDGHAGGACAQVVAKRLYNYIAACLLKPDQLQKYLDSQNMNLIQMFNEKFEFVDVLKDLYSASLKKFALEMITNPLKDQSMENIFKTAFLKLDDDLSNEALNNKLNSRVNLKTLSVAMSGTVTCVAHISGPDLHIASTGDCRAVLGVLTENNTWSPRVLSVEHNADNRTEVHRILKEHPKEEHDTIIKYDRLLGQLAPLRAFGDYRYKWPKNVLQDFASPHYGINSIPPNYHTPPYLTAMPDVTYHHLTPRDKFLVIASDGLWDFISPLQVVRMVGEHMRGKTILTPFQLPKNNMTLSEINQALQVRKESLSVKPVDSNACTHLIRNALGGTEYGLDEGRLSQLLSLPQDVVRSFRDDITITVIYFDEEYLRHCLPAS